MAKDLAYAKEIAEASNNKAIKVLDDLESNLQSSLSKLETFVIEQQYLQKVIKL